MTGFTYDAGALIAAERNQAAMWQRHRAALELGVVPVVPAPALAQVWRGGGRQAGLTRLLSGCVVDAMDRTQALRVGELAGRSGHHDVVDVAVVEGAARRGHTVLTSDPGDLRRVALATTGAVRIESI